MWVGGKTRSSVSTFYSSILLEKHHQSIEKSAIRTGGSTTQAGSTLTTSTGGSNLIHIDTNGTVTTGTSANQKSQGWLIWKVPHFTANQKNSVGNYHYQCSQHNSMWGQFNIMSIQANGGSFA